MNNTCLPCDPTKQSDASDEDSEPVRGSAGTRFTKSAVHQYFVLAMSRLNRPRWQCLLCGALCLAKSAGASRKLQHVLNLDTSFRPKKKKCWVKASEKEKAKEARRILTRELEDNQRKKKKSAKNKAMTKQLTKKRARSLAATDVSNASNITGRLMAITKSDVDNLWTRVFYGEGIKVAKVTSEFLRTALEKTIAYGPSYQLPSHAKMTGS
jgi:hypothetical protein